MTDEQDKFGKIEIRSEWQEAVVKTEMPLRLVVLGNFVPGAADVQDWTTSSRLINVNSDNFQSVMQQLNPHLSFDVPNRLSASPRELTVDLTFTDMKSFRPESIIQQVDVLANLMEIRRLTVRLRNRELTIQEFEEQLQKIGVDPEWFNRIHLLLTEPVKEIQAPLVNPLPKSSPKPKSKSEDNTLSTLFEMVDVGDKQVDSTRQDNERGFVDSLIHAVIQPNEAGPKIEKTIVDTIINELNQALSNQVNEIIHYGKFQQLESTWRGLKFLVDRTDFRQNIVIELLPVCKDSLRDAIYHQIFTPEYHEAMETPLSVMIADYEFNRLPEDMDLLGDIAQMATSIQVPFIGSVGSAFFGLQTPGELVKLPFLRSYLEEPEYAKWNALRDNEDTLYLALTMPQFLLRLPYAPDSIKANDFNFVEHTVSVADYLWGHGIFALAIALVRNFVENGWCIQITGLRDGGIIENLPVWSYRAFSEDVLIPLDVRLTQTREREFIDEGFTVISSRVNDDKAFVLAAPTIYRPRAYTTPEANREAQLHSTLPYQLYATRLSHYLRYILREISMGYTARQLQITLTDKLRSILSKPGDELPDDAVIIEVSDSKEKLDYYDVSIRISSPFQILGQNVNLLLGLELHH